MNYTQSEATFIELQHLLMSLKEGATEIGSHITDNPIKNTIFFAQEFLEGRISSIRVVEINTLYLFHGKKVYCNYFYIWFNNF